MFLALPALVGLEEHWARRRAAAELCTPDEALSAALSFFSAAQLAGLVQAWSEEAQREFPAGLPPPEALQAAFALLPAVA